MKTENLSIGLRVLYHAIEWLTVFLILLIFAVQIITPLYAVRVGRADSFLQQLQWLPYRPGVLALGVMLAAVGTILSKCSHEVDSGFLSRSSWQLYLLEGVLYSASALIFQQNCDKIALFAIVDMVDDPRALRQKRFLSAMIVVYLFCNMDAATSALHAVTLKQYLAFYSLHTRSVLQLVIESLSALEMILFILYMVLFISQQTSEKQEILNLNQQLQQANEQLRIYAEESAHTAQVQERNRLAREIHDTLGHVLTGITAGADACIQMMDDSPEMARHQMELIADTARNGMNDVRRSVKALRPDSLEKENLSGALNKMCTSMAQSSGAQIQLEESLAGLTLSQDEEDCVYRTVREAARGGSIIAPDVASKVLQMFSRMAQGDVQVRVNKKNALELTKMERQVIREVGCGLSNKEIAGRLYLSEGTVRNYISSILRKLELRDRTQLAIWAVQNQNSQPEADV